MISIDDVVANKYFSAFKGYVQPNGKVTSFTLWNPADSGVYVAPRSAFIYTQPYTAVNIKWRTSVPPGTVYEDRNSMFLRNPTSLLATSQAQVVINTTGTYAPQNDSDNYVLHALDKEPVYQFSPDVPPVLAPGTGLIWYPDTAAAIQWTMSLVWEEQAIPTP